MHHNAPAMPTSDYKLMIRSHGYCHNRRLWLTLANNPRLTTSVTTLSLNGFMGSQCDKLFFPT